MARRNIDPASVDLRDETLKALSSSEQQEAMEAWFHANFEHPAERTPYETAEGGYQWIWGGPHDAHDELWARFGGVVPDDAIETLSEKFSRFC